MDKSFLLSLSKPSEEERRILSESSSLYKGETDFVIKGSRLLLNKNIDVKLHTRFISFPLHRHDYMEIMYIYNGRITHHIEGKTLILKQGDLLFLNKHISHSIDKAGKDDIGINFILSDAFLYSLQLNEESLLGKFISHNLGQKEIPEYLLFGVNDIYTIRNLLDNLIYSLSKEGKKEESALPALVDLLFKYIALHKEAMLDKLVYESEENSQKQRTIDYLRENYQNATLSDLAKRENLREEYLSRKIKRLFGVTFKEMLLQQRLLIAENLLLSTDLKIDEIIEKVGYQNKSYFHLMFKNKHGLTPAKWKKSLRGIKYQK